MRHVGDSGAIMTPKRRGERGEARCNLSGCYTSHFRSGVRPDVGERGPDVGERCPDVGEARTYGKNARIISMRQDDVWVEAFCHVFYVLFLFVRFQEQRR